MPTAAPERRTARVVLTVFVALGSLLLLGSCKSVEETWGIPPFFEVYDTPSSPDWEPFVQGQETFVRPFYAYETTERKTHRVRFLHPFGDVRLGPAENRYVLLPLFRRQNRAKRLGGRDIDTMIFPFFFWGSDPEEGSYFAFFPIGGKFHGLLGKDDMYFVLFPLWMRSYDREKKSTHILWPLFNYISGAGWSGWRFWPFYANYRWLTREGELRTTRKFIMWPFYIRNQEFMHRDPTEIFMTFPFYGRRENNRSLTWTIFWPFYVGHYDKKNDKSLHGGYVFPYRFAEGQRDYWPFFGTKRTIDYKTREEPRRRFRQFALWPIQRYDWTEDGRMETSRLWVLPFWTDWKKFDKLALESERKWRLWPLMGYRRTGDRVAFDLLSGLWMDQVFPERFYGRLVAIFRYRSRPQYMGWEFLYGSLYWETRPKKSLFSLFGGLLEVGYEEESIIFRLLYIPWW